MSGINSVVLVGRVGGDPDYRRFQDGNEVCEFSIATSETWKDRNGERKERTQWHRVKVTNENVIKIVRDYVRKGDQIGIEGTLEYREWEKDGQKHKMAEVCVKPFSGRLHLLGSKDDSGGRGRSDSRDDDRRGDSRGSGGSRSGGDYGGRSGGSGGGGYGGGRGGNYSRDLDDVIPFAPEWR